MSGFVWMAAELRGWVRAWLTARQLADARAGAMAVSGDIEWKE